MNVMELRSTIRERLEAGRRAAGWRGRAVLAALALALAPAVARADFAHPLDTVPKPQVVVGFDTSVTMGISSDCSGCHDPGSTATRLHEAKGDILATLPMFRDYFVYGGFNYRGCESARIRSRILPDPDDPDRSYDRVVDMIEGARHCNDSERSFPGGASPSSGCITPTAACLGDVPIIQAIVGGALPGFNVEQPRTTSPVTCDRAGAPRPVYDPSAEVLNRFSGAVFSWPRWDGSPNASSVQEDFCAPIEAALLGIRDDLAACLDDPASVWDLSFLDAGVGTWCTPGTIAGSACTLSPLAATCVCNDDIPGCVNGPIAMTECDNFLTWKARQQVAVCESYSTAAGNRFGSFFRSQPDNMVNAGGCRENVALFFTDGYVGDTPGVMLEAADAQATYRSSSGLSNMFVFRVSNVFGASADAMQEFVSDGNSSSSLSAVSATEMQESFARVLSRVYKGVYNGSRVGFDGAQTRIAIHSFTVPGYNASGPVSDNYLGFPSRISWHRVRADGTIVGNPIFETDWQTKVTGNPGACGPRTIPSPMPAATVTQLGPNGSFRNGVSRQVTLNANTVDRNGDGAPDNHPALQWGRSFGFAASKPVIVEAPREAPGSRYQSEFITFLRDNRTRPRMIYYTDGGYLIGIHGGTYNGAGGTIGTELLRYTYNDTAAAAGTEVLRFRPNWLNASNVRYNYSLNNLVQQPLMTGEVTAHEVRVRVAGVDRFRTVLVGNQGKEGRGFFSIDVTDPCAGPSFSTSWTLPAGAYASARPAVHVFPMAAAPEERAAVITTGGLEGLPTLYAYDLVSGALLDSVALPGEGGDSGESYPTAPVCADVTGAGRITHCYLLREDGLLLRVPVNVGEFGAPVDITPSGDGNPRGDGRRFYASPAVYFGADGVVNLVFGSGDFHNLTRPAGENFVYRVKDMQSRANGVPNGRATVEGVCTGTEDGRGVFPLPAGERLLTSPIVDSGIVAWTTYRAETSGCVSGSSSLFAMDFETCVDAVDSDGRPEGRDAGLGLPSEPVLHRRSQTLMVQTSASPTANQTDRTAVRTRGAGQPWTRLLYWRLELDNR